jgi:hypothetical protein
VGIERDSGNLIQQGRQPAGMIVVGVADGQSVDRLRPDAQQLQIVQEHGAAPTRVEKDAPILRLDQKGHPMLTPE